MNSSTPAANLGVQLRESNGLFRISFDLGVTPECFCDTFIFIRENAWKRIEQVSGKLRTLLLGQI